MNEKLAIEVGNDLKALRDRLTDAKSVLAKPYKKFFSDAYVDAESKALVGLCGWKLQWRIRLNPHEPESYENQQTSRGCVVLVHISDKE